MTNTCITGPELLERRYPVILKPFSLRLKSGGRGKHRAGDGICREMLFLKKLTPSVLTERRVFGPYGLCGAARSRLTPNTGGGYGKEDCLIERYDANGSAATKFVERVSVLEFRSL